MNSFTGDLDKLKELFAKMCSNDEADGPELDEKASDASFEASKDASFEAFYEVPAIGVELRWSAADVKQQQVLFDRIMAEQMDRKLAEPEDRTLQEDRKLAEMLQEEGRRCVELFQRDQQLAWQLQNNQTANDQTANDSSLALILRLQEEDEAEKAALALQFAEFN